MAPGGGAAEPTRLPSVGPATTGGIGPGHAARAPGLNLAGLTASGPALQPSTTGRVVPRASPPSPPDYRRSAPPRGTRKDRRLRRRTVNPTARMTSAALRSPVSGDTRFSREASGDSTASSLRASSANCVRRIHPENFSHALVPRLFRGKTFLLSPVPELALQSPGLIGTACLLGQKTRGQGQVPDGPIPTPPQPGEIPENRSKDHDYL
jgi:hypothetical protein